MSGPTIARGLFAASLVLAAPTMSVAMPYATPPSFAAPIERAAMGCGVGRTRDAAGRCGHRFNRFDHRDRRHFHGYRERHCTTVETPNGRVRRCRV